MKDQHKPYHYFEDPQVCAGCHWDKFDRWNVSQHSKAFTGDFFQKQFYELVLPSESFAPELKDVKDGCIGCNALPEGDRIYHSAFIDSESEFTYAQWMCVEEIENRLAPLEVRTEKYFFRVPENLKGDIYLQAKLNYRRMPDSLADFFGIDRRPVIQVAKDVRKITINKNINYVGLAD